LSDTEDANRLMPLRSIKHRPGCNASLPSRRDLSWSFSVLQSLALTDTSARIGFRRAPPCRCLRTGRLRGSHVCEALHTRVGRYEREESSHELADLLQRSSQGPSRLGPHQLWAGTTVAPPVGFMPLQRIPARSSRLMIRGYQPRTACTYRFSRPPGAFIRFEPAGLVPCQIRSWGSSLQSIPPHVQPFTVSGVDALMTFDSTAPPSAADRKQSLSPRT